MRREMSAREVNGIPDFIQEADLSLRIKAAGSRGRTQAAESAEERGRGETRKNAEKNDSRRIRNDRRDERRGSNGIEDAWPRALRLPPQATARASAASIHRRRLGTVRARIHGNRACNLRDRVEGIHTRGLMISAGVRVLEDLGSRRLDPHRVGNRKLIQQRPDGFQQSWREQILVFRCQ